MLIVDSNEPPLPSKKTVAPLDENFGRNLDTVDKARQWLLNPHNWHDSYLMIIKWNGLLCTISKERAVRLFKEPWDNGLPEVIVREQIRLRKGGRHEDGEINQKEE